MKIVLNLNKKSGITYGVQYCETVEGFQEIKESYPDNTFIVADMFSQMLLDEFLDFLEFMGWTAQEWWQSEGMGGFTSKNFMPIQDEKDEEEAAYWECYDQPEGYAWPNGNPYESETYRHYGVFPSNW